jgi:hypothetical protein
MKIIEFNPTSNQASFSTTKFPSILVDLVHFQTNDSNWATRLSSSYINVTFSCFDKDKNLLGKASQILTLQVSPYQFQPYIVFNKYPIRFDINRLILNKQLCDSYQVDIELFGVTFQTDEKYTMQFHLLEHSNYQIFCSRVTIGVIFITDNAPNTTTERNVTVVPVDKIQVSANESFLDFKQQKHFIVPNSKTDDDIIQDSFTNNILSCAASWTKSAI